MILPRFSFTTKAICLCLLDGAATLFFNKPYFFGGQIPLVSLFFWNKATLVHYMYSFFLYALTVCLHIQPFEESIMLMAFCAFIAEGAKFFVVYSPQGRMVGTLLVIMLLNAILGWTIMQFVVNLLGVIWIIQRSS